MRGQLGGHVDLAAFRRIDPDPLMKYLLWVAIALFVFVVWYTYQNHAR